MAGVKCVAVGPKYQVKIDQYGFWLHDNRVNRNGRYGVSLIHAAKIAQRLLDGVPYHLASPMYDIDREQMSYFHTNAHHIFEKYKEVELHGRLTGGIYDA